MDQILDAPQEERINLEYAGFWIRLVAYVIDLIMLSVVGFVLGFAMAGFGSQAIGTVMNILIGVSYFALMESSSYQATLGKMAVGVKVGDHNGDQISLLNAVGRYFGKMISGLLLCIGFMMIGWDEKNQGIHDKLASTYVFFGK